MAKRAKPKSFEEKFRAAFNVAPEVSSEDALQQLVRALTSEPVWITVVWTLGGPSIRTSIDANDAEQVHRLSQGLMGVAQELQTLAFNLKHKQQEPKDS